MKPSRSWHGKGPVARRQGLRRLVALALLLAAKCARAAPPAPVLVFAGTEDSDHSQGVWLAMIYRAAVRRIGYRFEYRIYPAKRASALADSGAVDGEIHRVKSYGVDHPQLIRVAAPHFSTSFAAYGLGRTSQVDGWQSLGRARLRVEYRAGVVYCEQMLSAVVPAELLSSAYGIDLALRKLVHGRTDIYVDDERSVDLTLRDDEFRDGKIRKLAVLGEAQAFAYLHKRHGDVAPRLADALDQMRREGLIERYRQQAYGEAGK